MPWELLAVCAQKNHTLATSHAVSEEQTLVVLGLDSNSCMPVCGHYATKRLRFRATVWDRNPGLEC